MKLVMLIKHIRGKLLLTYFNFKIFQDATILFIGV